MRRLILIVLLFAAVFAGAPPAMACSMPELVPFLEAMEPRGDRNGAELVGFLERRSIANAPGLTLHDRSVVMTTRTWGDVSAADTATYVTPFRSPLRRSDCGRGSAFPVGNVTTYATYEGGLVEWVGVPGRIKPEQEARLERLLGPPRDRGPSRDVVVLMYLRLWWPNAVAGVMVGLFVAWFVVRARRRVRRIDVQTGRAPA